MTYLAYYLHWPMDSILQMDHNERRRWIEEVSRINDRLNGATTQEEHYDYVL